MKDKEWAEYFGKRLKKAERELALFENAVARHGLRVYHRDEHGERDLTEHHRQELKDAVEEYRALLRGD